MLRSARDLERVSWASWNISEVELAETIGRVLAQATLRTRPGRPLFAAPARNGATIINRSAKAINTALDLPFDLRQNPSAIVGDTGAGHYQKLPCPPLSDRAY